MTGIVFFSTTQTARDWLAGMAAEDGMSLSDVVRRVIETVPDAAPRRPTVRREVRVGVRLEDAHARSLRRGDGFTVSDVMAGMLAAYREQG